MERLEEQVNVLLKFNDNISEVNSRIKSLEGSIQSIQSNMDKASKNQFNQQKGLILGAEKQVKLLEEKLRLEKQLLTSLEQEEKIRKNLATHNNPYVSNASLTSGGRSGTGRVQDVDFTAQYKKIQQERATALQESVAKEKALLEARSQQEFIQWKRDSEAKEAQRKKDLHDLKKDIQDREKLRLQEEKKGWRGALSGGTTLGHKVVTTTQYAMAGTAIYGVASAFQGAVQASMKYDDAIYNNMAVLRASRTEAEGLAKATRELGIAYGGSIEEIDKLALTLGRAGVELADIKEATKAGVELATITGDSFGDSAKVLSSFITNFKATGIQVGELSDKLAYMANASKMTVEDLGTFANYGLQTAKSLGLTINTVGALATGLSNLGINASTIGTQMQKLDFIFDGSQSSIKQFWDVVTASQENYKKSLGDTEQASKVVVRGQEEFYKLLKSGAKESEQAFVDFVKVVQGMSDENLSKATEGMEINTKKLIMAIRNGGDQIIRHQRDIQHALDGTTQAQLKALGASTMAERAVNALTTATNGALTSLLDLSSRDELSAMSDEYTELTKKLNTLDSSSKEYSDTLSKVQALQIKITSSTKDFDNAFKGLSTGFETLITLIGTSGAAYLGMKGISMFLPAIAAGFTAASAGAWGFAGALAGVRAALLATGIGGIAVAVGGIATYFLTAEDAVQQLDTSLKKVELTGKDKIMADADAKVKSIESSIASTEQAIGRLKNMNSPGADKALQAHETALANLNKNLADAKSKQKELTQEVKTTGDVQVTNQQEVAQLKLEEFKHTQRLKELKLEELGVEQTAIQRYNEKIALIDKTASMVNELYINDEDRQKALKTLEIDRAEAAATKAKELRAEQQKSTSSAEQERKLQDAVTESRAKSVELLRIANNEDLETIPRLQQKLQVESVLVGLAYDKYKLAIGTKNELFYENEYNKAFSQLLEVNNKLVGKTNEELEKRKVLNEGLTSDLNMAIQAEQVRLGILTKGVDTQYENLRLKIEEAKIQGTLDPQEIATHERRLDELGALQRKKKDIHTLEVEYRRELEEMETVQYNVAKAGLQSLESGMMNFFDMSSEGWMNWHSLASSVLSDIYKQLLQQLIIKQLVSGIATGISGVMSPSSGSWLSSNPAVDSGAISYNANGGMIPTKGYASGGVISGGTGIRDDIYLGNVNGTRVFAMGGEFITRKDSVNPSTRGTLDYINKTGQVPNQGSAVSVPVKINIENKTGQDISADMVEAMTKPNEKGEYEKVVNIVLKASQTDPRMRALLKGR